MTPPASAGPEATARRRYRSPLREQRAQETRRTVLDAAHRLFTSRGWAATGIRDIAKEAGVAPETIYTYFSSKTALLRQVIDIAVVGDEEAVPLARRAEFAAVGQGRRSERLAAAAHLLTRVQSRTAPFAKLIRETAHSDEAMAEELASTRRRQRADTGRALTMVIGRAPTNRELDGIMAVVSHEVYLLLTETSGWSPEEYEAWIAATLDRIVPTS